MCGKFTTTDHLDAPESALAGGPDAGGDTPAKVRFNGIASLIVSALLGGRIPHGATPESAAELDPLAKVAAAVDSGRSRDQIAKAMALAIPEYYEFGNAPFITLTDDSGHGSPRVFYGAESEVAPGFYAIGIATPTNPAKAQFAFSPTAARKAATALLAFADAHGEANTDTVSGRGQMKSATEVAP